MLEGRRCGAARPPSRAINSFASRHLAEAIASSACYDLVVSSVSYDDRNETLVRSWRRAGVGNLATDWASLFIGQARFASFTHQEWVGWVAENGPDNQWDGWLGWVGERYGYA